eukprot:6461067-Amphidinium_carterae.1
MSSADAADLLSHRCVCNSTGASRCEVLGVAGFVLRRKLQLCEIGQWPSDVAAQVGLYSATASSPSQEPRNREIRFIFCIGVLSHERFLGPRSAHITQMGAKRALANHMGATTHIGHIATQIDEASVMMANASLTGCSQQLEEGTNPRQKLHSIWCKIRG